MLLVIRMRWPSWFPKRGHRSSRKWDQDNQKTDGPLNFSRLVPCIANSGDSKKINFIRKIGEGDGRTGFSSQVFNGSALLGSGE